MDAPSHLGGRHLVSPDQSSQPWTMCAFSTEEQPIDRISDLECLDERIAAPGQSLLDHTSQIGMLRQSLAACEATISALRASMSWRITAPLRAAKRLARKLFNIRFG